MQSRRDRRIVIVAVAVGALTCGVFIDTRTESARLEPSRVAEAPNTTRLPEQIGLGVYPIAAASDVGRPRLSQPDRVDADSGAASGSPPVLREEKFASAPRAATTTNVAIVDSAAARSAPRHAALSPVGAESADTAVVTPATADVLVQQAKAALSASLSVTVPDIRVARAIIAPLAIPVAAEGERLDSAEVRSSIARFVTSLRARASTSADLAAFYADGAEHRAELLPVTGTAPTPASARVAFDVKLSRYDAVGRFLTRILPVTMIVTKRGGDIRASAVTFGALHKP